MDLDVMVTAGGCDADLLAVDRHVDGVRAGPQPLAAC
jgi:hypothetical protein